MASMQEFSSKFPTLATKSERPTGAKVTIIASVIEIDGSTVTFVHMGSILAARFDDVLDIEEFEAPFMVAGGRNVKLTLDGGSKLFARSSVLASELKDQLPFPMVAPASPPTPHEESAKVQEWMKRSGYSPSSFDPEMRNLMTTQTTHWTITNCGNYGADDSSSDAGY